MGDPPTEERPDADRQRDDHDRSVIIRRRQRFIALALAGLTTSCGRSQEPPSATPDEQDEAAEPGEDPDGIDPADRPPPDPPKRYAAPEVPWEGRAPPRPCLRIDLPDDDIP